MVIQLKLCTFSIIHRCIPRMRTSIEHAYRARKIAAINKKKTTKNHIEAAVS